MSIHHLDVLRFLFGDPVEIYTAVRRDPRTEFEHTEGIAVSTLKFPSEVLAITMEDVWSGPRQEGFDSDIYIKWRVEGLDGVAQGTIGWPGLPDGLAFNASLLFQEDNRWSLGPTILGYQMVPACLCRRHGAIAVRFKDGGGANVIRVG
jgi:predicted dehydrogenase